jgi:hypothetical protein
MNDSPSSDGSSEAMSRAESMSALFANMVMQQANMGLMLLGKVPHPETGEILRELDSARMVIDQLEMLELKTKGNLDKREESLLKQSLMVLRMSFVEAVDGTGGGHSTAPAPQVPPPTAAAAPAASDSPPAAPAAEEDSRKKFSKKY